MRCASTAPTADPMIMAMTIHTTLMMFCTYSVATMASSIPTPAVVFPRRAVRGELSCLMPKMNRIDAMIYAMS